MLPKSGKQGEMMLCSFLFSLEPRPWNISAEHEDGASHLLFLLMTADVRGLDAARPSLHFFLG